MDAHALEEETAAFCYQALSAKLRSALASLKENSNDPADLRVISKGRNLIDELMGGLALVVGEEAGLGVTARLDAMGITTRGLSILRQMRNATKKDEVLRFFKDLRATLLKIETEQTLSDIPPGQLTLVEEFFSHLESRARLDLASAVRHRERIERYSAENAPGGNLQAAYVS